MTAASAWRRRLLGQGEAQQARSLQQALTLPFIAAVVLLGSAVAAHLGVPPQWWGSWAAVEVLQSLLFTGLVRSGWSARCRQPLLLEPQMLVGTLMAGWAYLMVGPYRALVIPGVMVVLLFGMFQLPRAACLRTLGFALVVMGAASTLGHARWPQQFPLEDEWIHQGMVWICLPAVSLLALHMSRLRHRLEEALAQIRLLATQDQLTGLPNRRHAETQLAAALQRQQRTGQPFWLALMDLDHFKRLNDEHGHAAGDAALQRFAQTAGPQLRGTDTLARWGGEEFLLMLEPCDDAPLVLQRLRKYLAAHETPLRFSAGLVQAQPGEAMAALLARADEALYRAKATGRDRVVQA